MLRKIFTSIFLFLIIFSVVSKAQTVQAGISVSGNSLIISAKPDNDLSGNMSGLNVTISWPDTYGSSIFGAITSSYGAIGQQGAIGLSGSNYYADFGFAGSTYSINWTNGSANELFRIAINQTGIGTGTFTLTNSVGGGWYFEVGGNDYTNYTTPFYASSVSNVPLPVELTSFNAAFTYNSNVKLDWKTSTEVNNYGFEIERLIPNDTNNPSSFDTNHWEKIGFVKGSGNSSSIKQYSFIDNNPSGGSSLQYRLKQIDNSGLYKYSDAVEIKVQPDKFNLFQNFPNPFNPTTVIKYQLPKSSAVKLVVYNVTGQNVITLVNKFQNAGLYEVNFNGSNLASGIYFYTIRADNFVQTKKLMLIK